MGWAKGLAQDADGRSHIHLRRPRCESKNGYRETLERHSWRAIAGTSAVSTSSFIAAPGIVIDGRPLALPAAIDVAGLALQPCDLKIPRDALFVLGDYAPSSLDSL